MIVNTLSLNHGRQNKNDFMAQAGPEGFRYISAGRAGADQTAEGDAEMTEELEIIRGSGNVYRDLGWPDAEARQMRAELAAEIIRELRERGLSQRQAAEITGLAQPDISRIKNADLKGFTIDRLVTVLNRLNQHVEIRVFKSSGAFTTPALGVE